MNNKFDVRTCGNGKRSRKYHKFPRKSLDKILESCSKISMRGAYRNYKWDVEYDERWPFVSYRLTKRFLTSNLGKNADTVYSEFVNKCKGLSLGCCTNDLRSEFLEMVYIPGECTIRQKEWAPFSVDSENRIIKNPYKNENYR